LAEKNHADIVEHEGRVVSDLPIQKAHQDRRENVKDEAHPSQDLVV